MKIIATLLASVLCFIAVCTDNIALGLPGAADIVIDRPGFALGYSNTYKQPLWVMYKLTRDEVITQNAQRKSDFKQDPRVPGCATTFDYAKTGYDKGHMAPAADMAFSLESMQDSFMMSNVSPQRPGFNRGIWRALEVQVRWFAVSAEEVYVVTGPIFAGKPVSMGASGISVPSHFYKVVYAIRAPEKMIAFIIPNEATSRPVMSFAVPVSDVERTTGLHFFPQLSKEKSRILKATIMIDAWPWL